MPLAAASTGLIAIVCISEGGLLFSVCKWNNMASGILDMKILFSRIT